MKHLEYAEKGVIFIKEFIPKSFAFYLANYFDILEKNGRLNESGDQQVEQSKTIYGDPAFDNVMSMCCDGLSQLIQINLLPTYTYGRIYLKDSELLPHKDRVECEHSVSLCLYPDEKINWPICFQLNNEEHDMINFELEPGDAVVYRGNELIHWRDKFLGERHYQLFMHYVDAQGSFKDCLFDTRPNLGLPAETKTNY
jgi:hypothetical protein